MEWQSDRASAKDDIAPVVSGLGGPEGLGSRQVDRHVADGDLGLRKHPQENHLRVGEVAKPADAANEVRSATKSSAEEPHENSPTLRFELRPV